MDTLGGEVAGKGWGQWRPSAQTFPEPVWPTSATAKVWADGKPVKAEILRNDNGLLMRVKDTGLLTVDYNSFRYAAGGDWSSRLKLWQVSDGVATPLATTNDEKAGTVSAQVTSAGIVAVAAQASGSSGDYTATSLATSSTWSAGGNSGAFSWSYPLRVPPAPGLQPTINLAYSSSSVDGRSEATNNQPSVLGEGFDYSPGFLERRYVPCSEDMENGASNAQKTGDQCWRSDNATLSLNGAGGELIFEAGKGWHSRAEDGSRIEKLGGASNGDNDGEYWKVTTTDGTQYFFGLNNLPGQPSTTESVFTTPVFGNHIGEPCRGASFSASSCTQAYRWNLDYVVDVRGNTMSYWYERESNKYARNNVASDDVSYSRGGVIKRIDYGTYRRTSAEHGVDQTSVSPVGQVLFDYADRCFTNCWSGADPVKSNWQDTPVDQICKATATECPLNFSPTFWTMKRLSKVSTKAGPDLVDSWTFEHSFPPTGDGTNAGLWLNSIVHKGHVGNVDGIALPPVTFEPVSMANRVLTSSNTTNNWQRISNIVLESGGKIHLDYSTKDCTSGNLPAPHTNTRRCYPVLVPDLSADPTGKTMKPEWWHKYVVTDLFEQDVPLANGHHATAKHTSYEYAGAPAWHYTDDDGLSKPDRRTWSQYRGYGTVKTRTGDVPDQTLQVTTFLRGMHGDRLNPAGDLATVTVAASLGTETVYDKDPFAGMVREQATYNGAETKLVSKTVNVPWESSPTATRTINGSVVHARFTGTSTAYSGTALGIDGSRGWRVSRAVTQQDHIHGTVDWMQNDGDIIAGGDEKCVKNFYNRNTTSHITGTLMQVTTTALRCDQNPSTVDDVISDVRNYYDGATSSLAPPVYGAVTKVEQLKDWTAGSGTAWQVIAQSTHDKTGRVITSTDLKGGVTTTAYTPAVGGPVTKVETVGPAPFSFKSTVEFKPAWGASWRATDANNNITGTAEFDELGRTRKVWKLGWSQTAHPAQPSAEYEYVLAPNRDNYGYVKTKALNGKGNYITSYQILDGLLRVRQTQGMSRNGDGSRVVADTIYDAHGRAAVTYASHAEPGEPAGTLWWEPEWSVPKVTKTEFDRASRPTAEVLYSGDEISNLVEKVRNSMSYEGDLTTKSPPQGGIPTTTLTDVLGHTTEMRQPGVTLQYRFNRKGQLAKHVDTAENEWIYTYDAKGRKQTEKDPDKGLTTFEYNDANELIKTTDANNKVLYTLYDAIGRKKELRDDSATGALRAEWKYDTLYSGQPGFKGQLTQAFRYEPAGSGNAYKWQVRQMNGRYLATGFHYVVPAAETGLGGTYIYSQEFSDFTGAQTSITYPAAGDLPAEKITTTFNAATGLATGLNTNWAGTDATMLAITYNAHGQPVETMRKMPNGLYVQDTTEFDVATGSVKRTQIKPETSSTTVSDRNYVYDPAGNPLSIEDKGDLQCFRYDALARLDRSWTPKAGLNCGATASAADTGGPAPYYHEWGFDLKSNKTSETSHTSAGDTTRTYTLPTGGATTVRPHAVTAMTTAAVTVNYQYDAAGNMTCRPNTTASNNCVSGAGSQILSWTAENKLATVSVSNVAVETNIYDVNGQRLVRRDSGGTTLYLPGQEIRRAGTVNSGTRYYTSGQTIATRTGNGISWVYDNHQATQQIAVDAGTHAVTIRRQTPYGSPRGTSPAWVSQKGFVGGDNDPTGLVNIGARQYDPLLGRFISVDPMLVADDPQQFDAYQYGAHNPIGNSDPTGTCVVDDNGKCNRTITSQLQQQAKNSTPDSPRKFCDAACLIQRNRENQVVYNNIRNFQNQAGTETTPPYYSEDCGYRKNCGYQHRQELRSVEEKVVDEFLVEVGVMEDLMIGQTFNGDKSQTEKISTTTKWTLDLGTEINLGFKTPAGVEGGIKGTINYTKGEEVSRESSETRAWRTPPGMRSYLSPDVSIIWKQVDHYGVTGGGREKVYLGRTMEFTILIKGSQFTDRPMTPGSAPARQATQADLTNAVVGRLGTLGPFYPMR